MVFLTSINPNPVHLERQVKAVSSWQKLGLTVFSLNTPTEVNSLRDKFKEINFIETNYTTNLDSTKPYIRINALLLAALSLPHEIFCIINSDIEILEKRNELDLIELKAKDGLVISRRWNYIDDISRAIIEKYGIDIFCFNRKLIPLIPESLYAIGQPFWDYWFPYSLINYNIPLVYYKRKLFLHSKHKKSWNRDNWLFFISLFKNETGIKRENNELVAKIIRTKIFNSVKEVIE